MSKPAVSLPKVPQEVEINEAISYLLQFHRSILRLVKCQEELKRIASNLFTVNYQNIELDLFTDSDEFLLENKKMLIERECMKIKNILEDVELWEKLQAISEVYSKSQST